MSHFTEKITAVPPPTVVAKAWSYLPWSDMVRNYFSAMSLLVTGYLFYTHHPHWQGFFSAEYHLNSLVITGNEILLGLVCLYSVCLLPFYLSLPDTYQPKSRRFWAALAGIKRGCLSERDKTALLATLVKFFFLPMMLIWLIEHVESLIRHWEGYFITGTFFPAGYWFIFQIILLVDVFFFVLAYAVEHPKLGNEIRSVEPTLFGWLVALICYPPFNGMTNQILGWHSADYPEYQTVIMQNIAGTAMLIFMAVYAWGSAALNLKAGNLTHRGIVRHGPYRWVRHPAYTAKNVAWWIGAFPLLAAELQVSYSGFVFAVLGMASWTFIYYLRATTEERHLLSDPVYADYCRDVPYRFIPKIY
ncbi:MAG: DUF1295 domain-containing protein [Gammaproteobacteria bacterium]|nr:DUF1295 domain-containing protein [Gammaproteobacteria bacterium]MDH5651447.1 DUF1295 domain-containing protein [Gammaproteobacteria bacterium]